MAALLFQIQSVISKRFRPLLLATGASLLLFFSIASSTSAFFPPKDPGFQPDPEARQVFTETYQQLKQGQLLDLSEVLNQLQHYPLAPYLEYQLFRNQIAYRLVDKDQLTAFLKRHPDTAFESRLKQEWLDYLASQESWESFYALTGSEPLQTSRLECHRLQAEAELHGRSLSWLEAAADFWRQHQPLPSACDPFSQSLKDLGFLNSEDYWQVALQLMRDEETSSAWELRQHLEDEQRQFLDYWRRGRLNPANRLQSVLNGHTASLKLFPELQQEVLNDLLVQHARTHPSQTRQFSQQLADQELITSSTYYNVLETLALRAAWRSAENTLSYFAEVPSEQRSAEGKEWYARTHLRLGNWSRLDSAIHALPEEIQQANEWRYWLAQALIKTDQQSAARELLQSLAKKRNYYGFLAAQELGKPPRMNASPAPLMAKDMAALTDQPGILRAGELFFTGFHEDARREWHYNLSGASSATWQQAAWLAQQWGWYDRSINAIHNAGHQDALELRFPLAHIDALQPLAEEAGLDLALVLALIRKESLFNPEARSSVGALGLMQVMPATGNQVSRQLQLTMHPERDLLNPQYNLPVGVHYLSQLMQRYQNDIILAAAAYNAGPSRANAWQTRLGKNTDPQWVEQITFAETRDYVKSVLAFREVYAWRLEQESRLQLASDTPNQPEG
ncbi:soluble lytic murein transglycosylase [Marinospirillum celere]|uniref:Soluble lytic murein transglycosylase n=1 Tax=Marinospirillum celere TaxID=1122252 RepID=A0A1I1DXT6_9GAMM|nr:transglycosylase SLT domain-containing protein [Marinospirillum celere]SFB79711.1 soluble lytic murein transglycosylase [Marinospirillum celere]